MKLQDKQMFSVGIRKWVHTDTVDSGCTVLDAWCNGGACTALVCGNSDGQPNEARHRCVLDFDMFHHLVALCFSLPALYADDDSPSADKQLLVATGGLNDLHALHLVFTAHVVQLLLAVCVNLKSEGNLVIGSYSHLTYRHHFSSHPDLGLLVWFLF